MRDPEINISHRLDELHAKLDKETDEKAKQQLRSEIREMDRRQEEIQRMKAYGVKFRKSL